MLATVEEKAFCKDKTARADWEKPPSYRKSALNWIPSAKKPETRAKRLATLIECSARGEKIPGYEWKKKG